MNIIKGIKAFFSRKKNNDVLELKRVSQTFGTLERLKRTGLIAWQERERRLFIAEPLARIMLRSREAWEAFMQNIMLWTLYNRQQEAWERLRLSREAKAVREAKKKVCILTKAERERVRRATRDRMGEGDIPVPKPEAFEIFIIEDKASPQPSPVGRENESSSPSIIAVGNYNPDTERTDMVMWEDIKSKISNENEN